MCKCDDTLMKELSDRLAKLEEGNESILEELDYVNRNAFGAGNGNIEYREI
ncbi:hypothetical protein JOC34_000838 [Virgibacillus halotolerans]|uniref:hypothetical protein n=1 Tax=Virgibacillus halotolerans TaxID=1071053 RepID=UPI0019600F75|nr:hypothetical protein [Virgibacillus halotolerans]MBM7598481.1 hypothetical protein [Virgibacillus halotolerans]